MKNSLASFSFHFNQAAINNLDFVHYRKEWGKEFSAEEIEKTIAAIKPEWVLFTHCETSTGVINDLEIIAHLSAKNNIKCYVDCISSVGCMPLNLSNVSIATASSGKGLGSIAGLAVVFCNIQPISNGTVPNYLDLDYYAKNNGIPFTISSNMVKALYEGCRSKLKEGNYRLIEQYSGEINYLLGKYNLLPYKNYHVFTIQPGKNKAATIAEELKRNGVLASYESKYLFIHNWLQLALFSIYNEKQVDTTLIVLKHTLKKIYSGKSLTLYN